MSPSDAGGPLLLLTPGPSRMPRAVLEAGATPMIHHRTPEFSAFLVSTLTSLRPLFGTEGEVLPVHTTGRGGLEAAICNLFSPGDEVLACCNGKFGEMWAGFAESYGLSVHRICADWSKDVDPGEVAGALRQHPATRGVLVVYCDTSTGVRNDVQAVAAAARSRGALTLVDGVCAIGGVPFQFDEWGVDIAVTASQKCLMASPGLAFVAVSQAAWKATAGARLPRNYWDFQAIKRSLSKERPETPGTAPVHTLLQVEAALRLIHAEGLPAVYARHERMAAVVRERARDLGLPPQCPALRRLAPTLTALAVPPGIPPKAVKEGMRRRGILVAGGLGIFQEKGFRVGHLGDIRVDDVQRGMDALAETMAELRTPTPAGTAGAR